MSQRATILIVSIMLIVAIAGGALWVIQQNTSETTGVDGFAAPAPFPFGDLIDRFGGETNTTPQTEVGLNKLIQIIEKPVGGYIVIEGNEDTVRYIEQETGHIYEYSPSGGITRLTNTTLPRIKRAQWLNNNTHLLISYEKTAGATPTILLAEMKQNTAPSNNPGNRPTEYILDGQTLPSNVIDFAVNPFDTQYALLRTTSAGVALSIHSILNQTGTTIFESAHPAWNISWETPDAILLTSKPSIQYDGSTILVDVRDGNTTRIYADVGLMSHISPDGNTFLHTIKNGISSTLVTYEQTDDITTSFGLATLADKCAFGDGSFFCAAPASGELGEYPQSWLLGQSLADDHLYRIDLAEATAQRIFEASEDPRVTNMYDLHISDTSRDVYFRNKIDNTLWVLER